MPHVVILGAGFAGLKAARRLKRARAHITLIDRNNYHLFQPLLYQVATAGLNPADIATPIRNVVRKQSNVEVLMGDVSGVDLEQKFVQVNDRKIPFDYLIVATGARHSYFGKDEWEKLAPGLKSIEDATHIRRKILSAFELAELETDPIKKKELLTFVIVGGGPTGVELAGSIAELAFQALKKDFRHIDPKATQVVLIEAGNKILASFPDTLSRRAQESLESLGVQVRLGGRVEQIDDDGVQVSGIRIAAKTVIWAAGVVASPAGHWLRAEVDRAGRVKVGADLTIPGHPDVFVIGDTALALDETGKPLPGVAPVAMQQGNYVAEVISKKISGKRNAPEPFRYINKGNLATIGRKRAIADLGRLKLWGFVAWMAWLVVHIFYLIGFRNRVLVLIQWAWAYLTFQRGARLITRSG